MSNTDIIVAGHICLDVIPTFNQFQGTLQENLIPGKLIDVGSAVTATGGPVSNTGLALYRLGMSTGLMGKVGDDMFGQRIIEVLRGYSDDLADSMVVDPNATTSYTIVISPPGVDRLFFHDAGANHTFAGSDVQLEGEQSAKIFHFGYPPLMRRMYADGGKELREVMKRAKDAGFTTSMDMAYPDPNSEPGRVDWVTVLGNVLPFVDVYVPSFDETLFMVDRALHDKLNAEAGGNLAAHVGIDVIAETAEKLLNMGAKVVGLKLGDQGFYLRTTADEAAIAGMGRGAPPNAANWTGRELLAPIFKTEVVGTTGSGDATIAGFLAAMLNNMTIEEAAISAVGVGACNVEAADSVSGIPAWDVVQERIKAGWEQATPSLTFTGGWLHDAETGLWVGPGDGVRTK